MCGDGKEAYRPVPKNPPDYIVYIAIGLAFLVGIFVGALLLPSIIHPPTRLMVQCMNNTSDLMETVKLARGIAP